MKKMVYVKLFLFSLLAALLLSMISLFCLVRISDMVVDEYRHGYLLYVARAIERSAEIHPITKIDVQVKSPIPEPEIETLSLLNAAEISPHKAEITSVTTGKKNKKKIFDKEKRTGPTLWLVSQTGAILSTNTLDSLPFSWQKFPLPTKIHGIRFTESSLFEPKVFVIKLDTIPETYLVSHNEKSLFQGPFLWIQGIHTFTTAALAVFLALSISFYYLRKKSLEARKVLSELGSGNLKARFEIKRFDEFGNLILDFNRMAQEIERLVMRLHETERSRSNLLQELGHDLRTPLTSLATSIDAFKFHHEKLNEEEKEELFSMIESDIRYFTDLLEKLTMVATIDEPQYKASTEKINLSDLLDVEIKNRQSASKDGVQWNLHTDPLSPSVIQGDSHLITRLFKNAFDNASRYAHSQVRINLITVKNSVEIVIMDDGPGLSEEALVSFGKRKERRELKRRNVRDFSLGLGSVIMKTIAEVHGGHVSVFNGSHSHHLQGACVKVVFQRS